MYPSIHSKNFALARARSGCRTMHGLEGRQLRGLVHLMLHGSVDG